MTIQKPTSVNEIRSAIDALTVRADLAHREGREQDAAELDHRIQAYREELGRRP